MKTFYRVSHVETQQGLWYDINGSFTGLIHNQMNFCKNNGLLMDFDEEIVGYLSAVPSIEDLYKWFTREDIFKLQEHNFFIHVYESDDFKFYEKFQHHVINKNNSLLTQKITLL